MDSFFVHKKTAQQNWGEPRGLYKGYNMGSVIQDCYLS